MKNGIIALAAAACLVTGTANATLLYDNGPLTGNTNRCNQGPTGCGGSGTWTFYDNFSLGGNANVTSFDYSDRFFGGGAGNYLTTNWSIWLTDPLLGGSPIASGSSVANLSALGGNDFLFTVTGLNLNLLAGSYWLGINNTLSGGAITAAGMVAFRDGARQSDGASYQFAEQPDRAFRIYGTVPVPEPISLSLMGLGLAALGARRQATKR